MSSAFMQFIYSKWQYSSSSLEIDSWHFLPEVCIASWRMMKLLSGDMWWLTSITGPVGLRHALTVTGSRLKP